MPEADLLNKRSYESRLIIQYRYQANNRNAGVPQVDGFGQNLVLLTSVVWPWE